MRFGERLLCALRFGDVPLIETARRTWQKGNEHEIPTRAAAIAYYALASLVPFLGIVFFIAVRVVPEVSTASGTRGPIGSLTIEEFRATLAQYLPTEANAVVATEIARLQKQSPTAVLSIGLFVSLWLASTLIQAIIDALNRIQEIPETRSYIKILAIAMGLTLVEVVLVLGSMASLIAWPWILRHLPLDQASAVVVAVIHRIVVFVMILLSFALMYRLAPARPAPWEWVTPGSLWGTVLLWAAGSLLQLYLHHVGSYGKTYGSLGGVLLLLFWFWIVAAILLFGAQLNHVVKLSARCDR
jgi:membrane protein